MGAKLVRDGAREWPWKDEGLKAFLRSADNREHVRLLKQKLLEEVGELIAATSTEEAIEEIADIVEVLEAIAVSEHGVLWNDVEVVRELKHDRKGGFMEGLVWDV